MLPPSGWHPDPHDPRQYRWWDGQRWTSSTYPRAVVGAVPVPATTAADSPGPTAEPPKRKFDKWKLPVVVLSILVVMGIGSLVVKNSDNSRSTAAERTTVAYTAPSTTPRPATVRQPTSPAPASAPVAAVAPPTSPAAPAVPSGLGKPYRDGKFEFVVHTWDGATASIEIRNIGDRPQTVSVSSLYLIDRNDRKFEPEFDWTSDLVLASLNPGQSVSGNLTYVLSGATASHLELHDSMFSGGVDVPLR